MSFDELRRQQKEAEAWEEKRRAAYEASNHVLQLYGQAFDEIIRELEAFVAASGLKYAVTKGPQPFTTDDWGVFRVNIGFYDTDKGWIISNEQVCWNDHRGRLLRLVVGQPSTGPSRIDRDKNIMELSLEQIRSASFVVPVYIYYAGRVSQLTWKGREDNSKIVREAINLFENHSPTREFSSIISVPIKHSDCFIATVVYGTNQAPEVHVLKDFRDKILQPMVLGRVFLWFYYLISPCLANFIKSRPKLKRLVGKFLVQPAVFSAVMYFRKFNKG